MRIDELPFSPADVEVIVPNAAWAAALRRSHRAEQDMVVELYATAIEREEAELRRLSDAERQESLQELDDVLRQTGCEAQACER